MQCGLFVSSSGTGHVINSPPWSLLVPQLPLYSQFYISRTFQSPHLLEQHVQAAFLSPPSGTRVWNQYLLLCSPELPAPGVSPPEQRKFSQSISGSGPLPYSYPESRPRGGSQTQQGRQRISVPRAPSLLSITPLCHRNGNLCGVLYFLFCRAPKKTTSHIWVSLSRSGRFLGYSSPVWTRRD